MVLAIEAKKYGAKKVYATDINPESVEYAKNRGLNVIKSDLFSNIKNKFDLIVFNPPYLPEDENEDVESALATTGGRKGDEIILRFLKQAVSHLASGGIILLLLSSLTPRKRINNLMLKLKLKNEKISSQKLFFEEIYVLKIKKA